VNRELIKLVNEAEGVIRESLAGTDKPLAVQFSGGKDSMAMIGLVRNITDRFFPAFMKSGIEFPEAVDFAEETARSLGYKLLISSPEDHLGGFFERLPLFGWPTIHSLWCNRDLKVRPQKKVLINQFGPGRFYKLVGIRKDESSRRRRMHKAGRFFAEDYQVGTDMLAYPLMNWESRHVLEYLESQGLPTSSLYDKYGVSGCYWCPFYQEEIYRAVLRDHPNLYDRFIEYEKPLGPSVNGYIFLGDIKKSVLEEGDRGA
jgi:phosphoadenosine phosphosulfate reductase